eukprot:TRINITY_DN2504_c0_g1_i1.p1 TRINITY_DN2504_c0_g1~~TRINITY_DN2504_c0_g1_i1.p1  ORF type:complete len:419 (+),score=24.23 TRINITY_DN2504_c0_g1_i1:52-1308(+)
MPSRLLLCLLCCTLGIHSSLEIECSEDNCRAHQTEGPTVVVKDTSKDGRLGNALFSYEVLLALKLGHGYEAYMGQRMSRTLSTYFDGLRLPLGSSHLCGFKKLEQWLMDNVYATKLQKIERLILEHTGESPKRGQDGKVIVKQDVLDKFNIDIDALVHSTSFNDLGHIKLPPSSFPWKILDDTPLNELSEEKYKKGRALILYPNGLNLWYSDHEMIASVPNIEQELSKDLTLKKKFLDAAEESITGAIKDYQTAKKKRTAYKRKDIALVGIHSRRTDHLGYERVQGYMSLKPSYFMEAMHLFKERYGERVLFLYVSDDLAWGKENLGPRTKKSKDLFFLGEGLGSKEDSIGHDLAVLKSCNHTIQSHGTFSYWAGFLSNGTVITPDHFDETRKPNSRIQRQQIEDPLNHPLPRLYYYL